MAIIYTEALKDIVSAEPTHTTIALTTRTTITLGQYEYNALPKEKRLDPNILYIINDYSNLNSIKEKSKHIYHEKLPQTCHKCGAPLTGYKCEYCGTEYR